MKHHYIITIHNTGDLLKRTLQGVEEVARKDSIIVPVLDGCTDQSSDIVRDFAKTSSHQVLALTTPDLHEIGAINAGLDILPNDSGVFVLQDDVVLTSKETEPFVDNLMEKFPRLGLVSMRMGGDIVVTSHLKALWQTFYTRGSIRGRILGDAITVNSCFDEVSVQTVRQLSAWSFEVVNCCIKSPIWISPSLRRIGARLDPALMPFCYDDLDLSIRALRCGLENLVAAVPYLSSPSWGGTRKGSSKFKAQVSRIAGRNRRYLFRKHYYWLKSAKILKLDRLGTRKF